MFTQTCKQGSHCWNVICSVERFEIEEGKDCFFDSLRVYDGDAGSGALLISPLCGQSTNTTQVEGYVTVEEYIDQSGVAEKRHSLWLIFFCIHATSRVCAIQSA